MTIQTLQERIANAESRIQKKQATITKKTEWIAKKQANLNKMDERERRWAEFDIEHWGEDITRLTKEIAETKASIETYKLQLIGEVEKEDEFIREVPESMKRMQNELVEHWDEFDINHRKELKAYYNQFGYREFRKKYTSRCEYEMMFTSEEQIHKNNERDAKQLIINLFNRVKEITGEVVDWSNIRAEQGTWGIAVLNGIVIGKKGKCKVESILAGGYNIQRLHVRVLTNEIL